MQDSRSSRRASGRALICASPVIAGLWALACGHAVPPNASPAQDPGRGSPDHASATSTSASVTIGSAIGTSGTSGTSATTGTSGSSGTTPATAPATTAPAATAATAATTAPLGTSAGTATATGPSASATAGTGAGAAGTGFAIVELRQYTLRPGQRDVLIELFEREFLESQEGTGMRIFGQFRDLDRPDRFVWFRGFRDMPARAEALQAFYFGPVWQAHRAAANATIDDSDNVLLLHPARPASGFTQLGTRPPPGATEAARGLFVTTFYKLAPAAHGSFAGFFEDRVAPALVATGAVLVATFATEHSPNNFPRLPVREHDDVFVSVARFTSAAAHARHVAALAASPGWRDRVAPAIARQIVGAPEVLRLAPTPRSRLRE